MQRLKVLVFSDCYIYGGSERLMSFLMNNEILNTSYDLNFFYRKNKQYENDMNRDFVNVSTNKVHALPLLSNDSLFHKINCLEINRTVKKLLKIPFFVFQHSGAYAIWNLFIFAFTLWYNKPDIIHINNGGYPAARSCNLLVVANFLFGRSKIVYQVNNQAQDSSYLFKIYDKFISHQVNFFLTASKLAKNVLMVKRGFINEKIEVINNCVPEAVIKLSREEICHDLGIPPNKFIISQVGFLTARKGQAHLLNSLHLLFRQNPLLKHEIIILFVGNGEDEVVLKQQVIDLDLCKNCYFLGYRDNSQDYINACDLFVLPSISNEDMPLVILNALQLGKPIIASNFAGISQALKHNRSGLLIDLNLKTFENDIAESIYMIFTDKPFRTALGLEAKESFKEFTPEKYGYNLSRLYNKLLKDYGI